MNLTLWKGHHEPALPGLIRDAWERQEPLILCPPLLRDFSFLSALPPGHVHCAGNWTAAEMEAIRDWPRTGEKPAFSPVLGVFTSGTMSASPRLVLYTRENVEASLNAVYGLFDRERIEHLFCYPQAFHTFGLTLGYVAAMLYGWKLHTPHGKYQRQAHADRMQLNAARTLTLGTPTHFYDWMNSLAGNRPAASYSCIVGGAGVTRELWTGLRQRLNIEAPSIGYGCTEASPGIAHLAPGTEPAFDFEIGSPLPSLNSRLEEDGVRISGPGLCAAIVQNGRIEYPRELLIRDRIRRLSTGSWQYMGRTDLTLNRGGQKFGLEQIEKVLIDRLSVLAVASAVRDARLGEDLGLLAVDPHARPHDELMRLSQDLLMDGFALKLRPERLIVLSELPLNECSKLDRLAAARLFQGVDL